MMIPERGPGLPERAELEGDSVNPLSEAAPSVMLNVGDVAGRHTRGWRGG